MANVASLSDLAKKYSETDTAARLADAVKGRPSGFVQLLNDAQSVATFHKIITTEGGRDDIIRAVEDWRAELVTKAAGDSKALGILNDNRFAQAFIDIARQDAAKFEFNELFNSGVELSLTELTTLLNKYPGSETERAAYEAAIIERNNQIKDYVDVFKQSDPSLSDADARAKALEYWDSSRQGHRTTNPQGTNTSNNASQAQQNGGGTRQAGTPRPGDVASDPSMAKVDKPAFDPKNDPMKLLLGRNFSAITLFRNWRTSGATRIRSHGNTKPIIDAADQLMQDLGLVGTIKDGKKVQKQNGIFGTSWFKVDDEGHSFIQGGKRAHGSIENLHQSIFEAIESGKRGEIPKILDAFASDPDNAAKLAHLRDQVKQLKEHVEKTYGYKDNSSGAMVGSSSASKKYGLEAEQKEALLHHLDNIDKMAADLQAGSNGGLMENISFHLGRIDNGMEDVSDIRNSLHGLSFAHQIASGAFIRQTGRWVNPVEGIADDVPNAAIKREYASGQTVKRLISSIDSGIVARDHWSEEELTKLRELATEDNQELPWQLIIEDFTERDPTTGKLKKRLTDNASAPQVQDLFARLIELYDRNEGDGAILAMKYIKAMAQPEDASISFIIPNKKVMQDVLRADPRYMDKSLADRNDYSRWVDRLETETLKNLPPALEEGMIWKWPAMYFQVNRQTIAAQQRRQYVLDSFVRYNGTEAMSKPGRLFYKRNFWYDNRARMKSHYLGGQGSKSEHENYLGATRKSPGSVKVIWDKDNPDAKFGFANIRRTIVRAASGGVLPGLNLIDDVGAGKFFANPLKKHGDFTIGIPLRLKQADGTTKWGTVGIKPSRLGVVALGGGLAWGVGAATDTEAAENTGQAIVVATTAHVTASYGALFDVATNGAYTLPANSGQQPQQQPSNTNGSGLSASTAATLDIDDIRDASQENLEKISFRETLHTNAASFLPGVSDPSGLYIGSIFDEYRKEVEEYKTYAINNIDMRIQNSAQLGYDAAQVQVLKDQRQQIIDETDQLLKRSLTSDEQALLQKAGFDSVAEKDRYLHLASSLSSLDSSEYQTLANADLSQATPEVEALIGKAGLSLFTQQDQELLKKSKMNDLSASEQQQAVNIFIGQLAIHESLLLTAAARTQNYVEQKNTEIQDAKYDNDPSNANILLQMQGNAVNEYERLHATVTSLVAHDVGEMSQIKANGLDAASPMSLMTITTIEEAAYLDGLLQSALLIADTNKDGQTTDAEETLALQRARAAIDAVMKNSSIDADNDGYKSRGEYDAAAQRALKKIEDDTLAEVNRIAAAIQKAKDDALANGYDADGDGVISPAELAKAEADAKAKIEEEQRLAAEEEAKKAAAEAEAARKKAEEDKALDQKYGDGDGTLTDAERKAANDAIAAEKAAAVRRNAQFIGSVDKALGSAEDAKNAIGQYLTVLTDLSKTPPAGVTLSDEERITLHMQLDKIVDEVIKKDPNKTPDQKARALEGIESLRAIIDQGGAEVRQDKDDMLAIHNTVFVEWTDSNGTKHEGGLQGALDSIKTKVAAGATPTEADKALVAEAQAELEALSKQADLMRDNAQKVHTNVVESTGRDPNVEYFRSIGGKQFDDILKKIDGGDGIMSYIFGSGGPGVMSAAGGWAEMGKNRLNAFGEWWGDVKRGADSKGEAAAYTAMELGFYGILGLWGLNKVQEWTGMPGWMKWTAVIGGAIALISKSGGMMEGMGANTSMYNAAQFINPNQNLNTRGAHLSSSVTSEFSRKSAADQGNDPQVASNQNARGSHIPTGDLNEVVAGAGQISEDDLTASTMHLDTTGKIIVPGLVSDDRNVSVAATSTAYVPDDMDTVGIDLLVAEQASGGVNAGMRTSIS